MHILSTVSATAFCSHLIHLISRKQETAFLYRLLSEEGIQEKSIKRTSGGIVPEKLSVMPYVFIAAREKHYRSG